MQEMAQKLNREAEEVQWALHNPASGWSPAERWSLQNEIRGLHQRLDEINRRLDELMEMARRERR